MEARLRVLDGVDETLVLVAPDDEVQPVRQHVLGQISRRCVRVVVLVQGQQVEPVALLHVGPEPRDLAVAEGPEHALVAHVAEPVQRQLCPTFLQQDGPCLDLVRLGYPSKVVDEPRDLQQVQRAEVAVAARVVVVAVDGEYRDGDVDVGIFVVHVVEGALEDLVRVAEELQLARLHTQAVFTESPHNLVHRFARRLIVVEEIAR